MPYIQVTARDVRAIYMIKPNVDVKGDQQLGKVNKEINYATECSGIFLRNDIHDQYALYWQTKVFYMHVSYRRGLA